MDAGTTLDQQVRRHVYNISLQRGSPPVTAELTALTHSTAAAIRESLARLATARVLVLQPESGEILMAPPFSSVPTPFVVRSQRQTAFANCGWDALGISVMRHEPAEIDSACGCCGEALAVRTRDTDAPLGGALLHFAVPARRWWDDIVFT
jgi:hypothetical protein